MKIALTRAKYWGENPGRILQQLETPACFCDSAAPRLQLFDQRILLVSRGVGAQFKSPVMRKAPVQPQPLAFLAFAPSAR